MDNKTPPTPEEIKAHQEFSRAITQMAVQNLNENVARESPSIVCPRCNKRSFHPKDIEERYCGFCHNWHENMRRVTQA
jgi:ribosomal protein L37E